MGKLTEMIEFLNATPKELQEYKNKNWFTHFTITDEAKKIRRKYIKK